MSPESSVEEVDAPATGVVSKVFVEDGQMVSAGTHLVAIESKGLSSRHDAVITTIEILRVQNASLKSILTSNGNLRSVPLAETIPQGVDEPLRSKLVTAINQSREILARLRQVDQRIISKAETLQLLETIEADFRPLLKLVAFLAFSIINNATLYKRKEQNWLHFVKSVL